MEAKVKEDLASLPEGEAIDAPEWQATVGQSFARLETIYTANKRIYGCWSATFSGACEEAKVTWFSTGAVIDYQGAGDCDGKAVMAVTHT